MNVKNGAVGIAALLLALSLAGCGRGGRPNVLLITLDTTRADRLGCYGATNAYTPNLDRLAKDGAVYEQARTTCPLTLPAHASLLTGLTPLRHGLRVNDAGKLPEAVATLPGLFRSRGYATAAFVSAAVLDGRYGLNRGFDHYDDRLPDELFGEAARQDPLRAANPPETGGDETANRVIQWFEGRRAPWFVWVHFYDAHAPYQPHAAFEGKGVLHPYDQEIAFVDEQVGRLVKMLKKRGEYRRTVVVAVGDHGESLGEHGELEHGMTLYEGAIRVPLIIKGGGRGMRGKRISRPVSITQVAPLLAAEAGSSWSAGEVGDRQSSL
ncbi:MAG: sulfatase, partial [Candidatus Hydrogenedens sp.]|nr:sulfatase [Candidatus Hydrogenedens sp.]